jgi:methylenetetrahydrofolate dehydrogenase (NADP+) / methenyltetrahydrofolate cyclohydrolase
MRFLNGAEIAGFIKERQAHQVRGLRQAKKIFPKLAIVACGDNPVNNKYVQLKQSYGAEILIDVEVYKVSIEQATATINTLNTDDSVHGIIVQLPLPDASKTDEIVDTIAPHKDVDGLGKQANFDPATPIAIMWLLNGYNIQLNGKNITVVGNGRLVGAPLVKMLQSTGLKPTIVDEFTKNSNEILKTADIVISAVGKPGIIEAAMLPNKCVVVDAGVASEDGVLKGDITDDVYDRDDLTITPKIGGVGPLTVAALFDNLLRSASK